MTMERRGVWDSKTEAKTIIKDTMVGVQGKDDGMHYRDDLGNGENDLILPYLISSIANGIQHAFCTQVYR